LTNAGELRNELERGGHRFSARTDEELIAHAYDRWGTRAFERLRGAFACAIWDAANRRLVLARDHVGVRSLYFAVLQGRGIVFASDVRALLQDPGIARESCPDGIDTLFRAWLHSVAADRISPDQQAAAGALPGRRRTSTAPAGVLGPSCRVGPWAPGRFRHGRGHGSQGRRPARTERCNASVPALLGRPRIVCPVVRRTDDIGKPDHGPHRPGPARASPGATRPPGFWAMVVGWRRWRILCRRSWRTSLPQAANRSPIRRR
jgi:hypothetical protein